AIEDLAVGAGHRRGGGRVPRGPRAPRRLTLAPAGAAELAAPALCMPVAARVGVVDRHDHEVRGGRPDLVVAPGAPVALLRGHGADLVAGRVRPFRRVGGGARSFGRRRRAVAGGSVLPGHQPLTRWTNAAAGSASDRPMSSS